MRRRMMFHPTLLVLSISLSGVACAAPAAEDEKADISWFAEAGFGYDSNVFRAPRSSYIDYAAIPLGSNPTVVPRIESGSFVPYEARVEAGKQHELNGGLVGSATVDGRHYFGGLSDADESNLAATGGMVFNLGEIERSKRTAYVGAVYEQHHQVYVDHDSGASKTISDGSDISDRYNYSSVGLEGEYKHRMERLDYALKAKYLVNDYSDPVVVSQLDHNYFSVGGEIDYELVKRTKLKFSAARSTREYSDRHARDINGVYSSTANPLLAYTYNTFGVTLRNRVSSDWLFYVDYDYSQRTDDFVNYNDYKSHRYGGRLIYEQGALKAKVALHHWERDYPHAFAYDVSGQPDKTYSGNKLRFKGEFAHTRALSLWAEAILTTQDSSDLRYAYDRRQIMAGVRWEH